ncbi:flagellar export chaperone FliS [Microvenator marinus]|jgi:flagellar protein FliS|uniref:Flagellar secretion chaperone FliS n=1 Tax=Microvenator marinus TaxID=2600177 RepID=A0A5B8XYW3_9DELT|nr:flagellar export chaperone FliS [Microvenator marinus]QED28639.1 flagellar export chaperone FliS [Microvenator marinus]
MKAINTYKRQSLTTADPWAILIALYDGLLRNLHGAVEATKVSDFAKAGEHYRKALAIISELEAAVNLNENEAFGRQLLSLYGFFSDEILKANLRAEVDRIAGILEIISGLRQAWDEAARSLRAARVA